MPLAVESAAILDPKALFLRDIYGALWMLLGETRLAEGRGHHLCSFITSHHSFCMNDDTVAGCSAFTCCHDHPVSSSICKSRLQKRSSSNVLFLFNFFTHGKFGTTSPTNTETQILPLESISPLTFRTLFACGRYPPLWC